MPGPFDYPMPPTAMGGSQNAFSNRRRIQAQPPGGFGTRTPNFNPNPMPPQSTGGVLTGKPPQVGPMPPQQGGAVTPPFGGGGGAVSTPRAPQVAPTNPGWVDAGYGTGALNSQGEQWGGSGPAPAAPVAGSGSVAPAHTVGVGSLSPQGTGLPAAPSVGTVNNGAPSLGSTPANSIGGTPSVPPVSATGAGPVPPVSMPPSPSFSGGPISGGALGSNGSSALQNALRAKIGSLYGVPGGYS